MPAVLRAHWLLLVAALGASGCVTTGTRRERITDNAAIMAAGVGVAALATVKGDNLERGDYAGAVTYGVIGMIGGIAALTGGVGLFSAAMDEEEPEYQDRIAFQQQRDAHRTAALEDRSLAGACDEWRRAYDQASDEVRVRMLAGQPTHCRQLTATAPAPAPAAAPGGPPGTVPARATPAPAP